MQKKLVKAWMSNSDTIIKGWALVMKEYDDDLIIREDFKIFTKDGKKFTRESYGTKIFLDEKSATDYHLEEKDRIEKYHKEQIEYHKRKLES